MYTPSQIRLVMLPSRLAELGCVPLASSSFTCAWTSSYDPGPAMIQLSSHLVVLGAAAAKPEASATEAMIVVSCILNIFTVERRIITVICKVPWNDVRVEGDARDYLRTRCVRHDLMYSRISSIVIFISIPTGHLFW